MKKILLILLALTLCISLCACGGGLEGTTLNYMECTARFSNGTLYLDVFGSQQTYSYELGDDNTITLEGILTYTYEIDGNMVTFDGNFMGVSDVWFK